MSEILKKLKDDLKTAMTNEVALRKSGITHGVNFEVAQAQKHVSRGIISMYPELGIKPDKATDDDTIKLLKKYIMIEKTRELYLQKHLTSKDVEGVTPSQLNTIVSQKMDELGDKLTSDKIKIAQEYLPKSLTEEELIIWVKENIDFSQFKNKMQAMKIILNQFKGMDGNFVKKVLTSI